MQAISLYWFAAQQQTSTLRPQKFGLFYLKFSAKLNELNATESDRKMVKTKVVRKNANSRRSEAKC